MASELLKIFVFVLTAHVLIFFTMQSAFLTSQSGSNPHKSVFEEFLSGDFTETVEISDDSGIISGTIALAAKTLDFIGFIAGITVSPALLMLNSPLPTEIATLFGVLLTFLEIGAVAYFMRGIS